MKELEERMSLLETLLTDLAKIVLETLVDLMKEKDDCIGLAKLMGRLQEWLARMEKAKS